MKRLVLTVLVLLCLEAPWGIDGYKKWKFPFFVGNTKNAAEVNSWRQIAWNAVDDDDENSSLDDTISEISCEAFPNHMQNTMSSYKSVGCKPRKTVIPVASPVTLNQVMHIHPTHVEVNRCSGMCASDPYVLKTCQATQVKTVDIPLTAVVMKSLTDAKAQCFVVKMEEHVECGCDCSVQERHCHTTQIYNKSRCRCECKNAAQSTKCSEGKVWDPVTCNCECAEQSPCSTGYLFHPDYCTCVKINWKKPKSQTPASKFQRIVFRGSK